MYNIYTHIYICIYIHLYMFGVTHVYIRKCMTYIHIYICIYIHLYIFGVTHTHTHSSYAYIHQQLWSIFFLFFSFSLLFPFSCKRNQSSKFTLKIRRPRISTNTHTHIMYTSTCMYQQCWSIQFFSNLFLFFSCSYRRNPWSNSTLSIQRARCCHIYNVHQ